MRKYMMSLLIIVLMFSFGCTIDPIRKSNAGNDLPVKRIIVSEQSLSVINMDKNARFENNFSS